jgi:alkylation response protein AidB-like acyl-CoA dehydrogenase
MDLTFSDELLMLRDLAREFTDNEIRPRAAEIERTHHVPRELLDKLAEVGLMGVAIPEEYGGSGLGETGLVRRDGGADARRFRRRGDLRRARFDRVDERARRRHRGAEGALAARHGAGAQARRLRADSEANAGSDAGAMTTTATRDGDDWVLNGEKSGSPTATSPTSS